MLLDQQLGLKPAVVRLKDMIHSRKVREVLVTTHHSTFKYRLEASATDDDEWVFSTNVRDLMVVNHHDLMCIRVRNEGA